MLRWYLYMSYTMRGAHITTTVYNLIYRFKTVSTYDRVNTAYSKSPKSHSL